ncbi:hypothetical protein BGZ76_002738 [Entomortierella beljakovae]|nr:hypothetical protein BGZ76_002738 [Entomortierella beljakovae]
MNSDKSASDISQRIVIKCKNNNIIIERHQGHLECHCSGKFLLHGDFMRHIWSCPDILKNGNILTTHSDYGDAYSPDIESLTNMNSVAGGSACDDVAYPVETFTSEPHEESVTTKPLAKTILDTSFDHSDHTESSHHLRDKRRKMLLSNVLDPNKKLRTSADFINETTEAKSIVVQSSDIPKLAGSYDEKIAIEEVIWKPSSEIFIDILKESYPRHSYNATTNSHFQIEAHKKYVAVNSSITDILNQDWDPVVLNKCHRILDGMMIVNQEICICVQAVELYNRNESIDKHREGFCRENSLPGEGQNIKAVVLTREGYQQLVIGTHVFNALVTAYIDVTNTKSKIHLGPTYSGSTRFIDSKFYFKKSVLGLLNGDDTLPASQESDIFKLRQVRSQFHDLSTYKKLRSWGSILDTRFSRPVTIWTLHLYPSRKRVKSAVAVASEVLALIANEVWTEGEHATIKKENINAIISTITTQNNNKANPTKIEDDLTELLKLFEDNDTLKVIGNEALNRALQNIVRLMSSNITSKNHAIAKEMNK